MYQVRHIQHAIIVVVCLPVRPSVLLSILLFLSACLASMLVFVCLLPVCLPVCDLRATDRPCPESRLGSSHGVPQSRKPKKTVRVPFASRRAPGSRSEREKQQGNHESQSDERTDGTNKQHNRATASQPVPGTCFATVRKNHSQRTQNAKYFRKSRPHQRDLRSSREPPNSTFKVSVWQKVCIKNTVR